MRRIVGRRRHARQLLAVGAVMVAAWAALGGVAIGAPTLTLKADVAPIVKGQPYRGTISATADAPITGCYRWRVTGLPTGFRIDPEVTCANAGATRLDTSILGTLAGDGVAQSFPLTVDLFAVDSPGAQPAPNQPPATEQLKTTLFTQPDGWEAPQPDLSYANTSLSLVSCPDVSDCWVYGSSGNPASANKNVSPTGEPAVLVAVPGRLPLVPRHVIAGGAFVARIGRLSPLRLDVVRTGIPGSWTSLSCLSASECLLAGSTANSAGVNTPAVLRMTVSGKKWNVVPAGLTADETAGAFSAISCVGHGCALVGRVEGAKGPHAYTALIGSRDTVIRGAELPPEVANDLASVSCTTRGACVAVGTRGFGATGSAGVIVSPQLGSPWRVGNSKDDKALQPWLGTVDGPLTFGTLSAVGCSPDSRGDQCAAVWPFWWALTNTSDGQHWLPDVMTQAPYGLPGAPAKHMSCAPGEHCFLPGNPSPSDVYCLDHHCTFVDIMESIPSGDAWKWGIAGIGPADTLLPSLADISCPTATGCVAVGQWKPFSPDGPLLPLVMAPQHPNDPFFVAPRSSDSVLTLGNLALVLGLVSLVLTAPELVALAPELGLLTDAISGASAIFGTQAAIQNGDPWGALGALMGWYGLLSKAFGLPGISWAFKSVSTPFRTLPSRGGSSPPQPPPLPLPDWLQNPSVTGGVDIPT